MTSPNTTTYAKKVAHPSPSLEPTLVFCGAGAVNDGIANLLIIVQPSGPT